MDSLLETFSKLLFDIGRTTGVYNRVFQLTVPDEVFDRLYGEVYPGGTPEGIDTLHLVEHGETLLVSKK